jgi:hypothetical protein
MELLYLQIISEFGIAQSLVFSLQTLTRQALQNFRFVHDLCNFTLYRYSFTAIFQEILSRDTTPTVAISCVQSVTCDLVKGCPPSPHLPVIYWVH